MPERSHGHNAFKSFHKARHPGSRKATQQDGAGTEFNA